MGFYGQSFLRSFGTFLGQFITKNKNANKQTASTHNENDAVVSPAEKLTIQNGNHWISINADGTDTIEIGHAAPGTEVKHTVTGLTSSSSGSASKELAFGSYITVPTVTYDATGHEIGYSTTTYKIPAVDFTPVNNNIANLTERVEDIEEFLDTVKDAEELYF